MASREAINSPLLDGVSINGARNVLVNISAGANLGMRETTTATSIIQQEAGDEAEIILGTVLDENFGEEIRVTVIATGFDLAEDRNNVRVAPNKPAGIPAEQTMRAPAQLHRLKRKSQHDLPVLVEITTKAKVILRKWILLRIYAKKFMYDVRNLRLRNRKKKHVRSKIRMWLHSDRVQNVSAKMIQINLRFYARSWIKSPMKSAVP